MWPACHSLERSAVAIAGAGGSGSVKVFADSPCPWTAVSNDPAWLTISGGSTGSGAGTVSYAVAAQPSPGVRTGTLTVAGKTFTVTQVTAVSRIKLVSVGFDGLATDDNSSRFTPAISADGRWIAFDSKATNLVAGDTNGLSDIFVYDAQTATIARVSVGPGGAQADDNSGHPAISADGRFVAVHVVRHQSGARRHERRLQRLRLRSADGVDIPCQRRARRRRGE